MSPYLGRRFKFRDMEFWPERGLIHIIDERFPPNDERAYKVDTVFNFFIRAESFRVGWQRDHAGRCKYPSERAEYEHLIEDMYLCCREASKQGRPDDPQVIAEMVRQRRRYMIQVGSAQIASPFGAIASSCAPESASLPPMPQANLNKPFTPLCEPG